MSLSTKPFGELHTGSYISRNGDTKTFTYFLESQAKPCIYLAEDDNNSDGDNTDETVETDVTKGQCFFYILSCIFPEILAHELV